MSLWKRLSRAAGLAFAPAEVPAGMRVYAVGDIHGRSDLLDELLERIEADKATGQLVRSVTVFLGDLIDRGPDSAGVVERLRQLSSKQSQIHCLVGNHEEALLRAINAERGWLPRWLEFGGDACVSSYGVDPNLLGRVTDAEGAAILIKALPPSHVVFLRSFQDTVSIGGYLFAHAGIRPGVPLAQQSHDDLRWIREPFLSDTNDHGTVVVHGHTVVNEPDDRGNRVGIDTGAYYSGRLTALVLEGTARRYLTTGSSSTRVRSQ